MRRKRDKSARCARQAVSSHRASRRFNLSGSFLALGGRDRLSWNDAMASAWLIGDSGSGKTSGPLSMMVLSALRAGASLCFTTVKPSDTERWEALCRREGRAVRVFRLGEDRFNPLAHVQRTAAPGAAVEAVTSECLVPLKRQRKDGAGGDPHWKADGERFVRSLVTIFTLAGESVTFRKVCESLINLPHSVEETHSAHWRQRCPAYGALHAAQSRISTQSERAQLEHAAAFLLRTAPNTPPRTLASTVATVCAPLDQFAAPGIIGDTLCAKSDTWSPAKLFTEPSVVIFDAAVQRWGPAGATVQRLLLNAVQREALGRDLNCADHPLMIVADEFQEFLDPDDDAAFLRTARDRRAFMVMATQCLGNITDACAAARDPHAAAQKMLGLGAIKIFTATTDPATARFCSEVFAQRWQPRVSFGSQEQSAAAGKSNPGRGGGRSSTVTRELLADVAPHELLHLRRGGPENDWMVDAFLSCSGRIWHSTGRPSIKVAFPQVLF